MPKPHLNEKQDDHLLNQRLMNVFPKKCPEKHVICSKFWMIFDLIALNISLLTGGHDVSYVKIKLSGVVKNAKKDYA